MYFFGKHKVGIKFWKLVFSKTDKKFWKMEYDDGLEFGCRKTKPTPMNITKSKFSFTYVRMLTSWLVSSHSTYVVPVLFISLKNYSF
jgi:hypothetical protein